MPKEIIEDIGPKTDITPETLRVIQQRVQKEVAKTQQVAKRAVQKNQKTSGIPLPPAKTQPTSGAVRPVSPQQTQPKKSGQPAASPVVRKKASSLPDIADLTPVGMLSAADLYDYVEYGLISLGLLRTTMDNPLARRMLKKMRHSPKIVNGYIGATDGNVARVREALFGDTDEYCTTQLEVVDDLFRMYTMQVGQGSGPSQQGHGENHSIQKVINTLLLLQGIADGYTVTPPTTRMEQYRYDYQVENYAEMLEEYSLTREDIAWFAADGEVSLVELFMMEMNAEGGSVDARQIPYLANRMHYWTYGKYHIAEMLTVEDLLNVYENGEGEAQVEAKKIIQNLLGHDDAILGPGDYGYDSSRSEDTRITNIQNLVQAPSIQNELILRTWAEAVVNWVDQGSTLPGLEDYTRWMENGSNTGYMLIPANYEDLELTFNDALPRSHEMVRSSGERDRIVNALRDAGLGEPVVLENPDGTYSIFYGAAQYNAIP
jgi:hypothetical protein